MITTYYEWLLKLPIRIRIKAQRHCQDQWERIALERKLEVTEDNKWALNNEIRREAQKITMTDSDVEVLRKKLKRLREATNILISLKLTRNL